MSASFKNARRIAGYSWKLYAAASVGLITGTVVIALPITPSWLYWLTFIGMITAVWFSVASFLTFHWMFDRSNLLSGEWLRKEFDSPPSSWLEINAGLDETTIPVYNLFPHASGKVLDIYDPQTMTEPALQKAREDSQAPSVRYDSIPIASQSMELVLVTLAAHEIRDRTAREKFFSELKRITSSTGKLIVVEHLRDLPATLVFGPAVFHFLPRSEWTSLAEQTQLTLKKEYRITPFIRVFVLNT